LYEHHKTPLLSRAAFLSRFARHAGIGFCIITVSLGVGMLGYHHFEDMPWIDAFVNASMILSGMGPVGSLQTNSGKLFAGLYALYSGLALITIVGIVFAPVVHRFFHKFHLESHRAERTQESSSSRDRRT
jgi:hypothetical protein